MYQIKLTFELQLISLLHYIIQHCYYLTLAPPLSDWLRYLQMIPFGKELYLWARVSLKNVVWSLNR
jgi:hypothetical protein